MENILIKIGELNGVLGDFRNEVSKIIKEISERKEQQDLIKIAQDTRSQELDVREVEIKKVENIIALNESTKNTLAEIEIKAKDLSRSQQAFNENVAKQKQELNEITIKCNREQEMITKEHTILDKREQQMKEKEQDFVAKLLAKISELK